VNDLDLVSPSNRATHRGRSRGRIRRRLRSCIPVFLALAVIVAGLGVGIWKGTDAVRGLFVGPADFSGDGQGRVTVEVGNGDSAGDIAVTLEREGVVASAEAFTEAATADSRSLGIQPGFYELNEKMSAQAALDLLVSDGARIEKQVTVAEGLTVRETIAELADQTRIPVRDYTQAARAPGRLGLPDYARGRLEGYLFPATYPLPPKVSPTEVLRLMVGRLQQAADAVGLEAGAERLGLTAAEVVTVASLVQSEAGRVQDFPKVAAVIYNRLDQGTELQLDSTVQFATGGTGVFTTDAERRDPSPYNTYRYRGLPPGPIAAPGQGALRAALEPAGGDWTFFVTVDLGTGRTLFTDDAKQHLRNVRELRAYCATSEAC